MPSITTTFRVRDAIGAANEAFMVAFGRGDVAGLAAMYTRDGQILPPNGEVVVGCEAIERFWQSLVDMGVKKAKLDIREVEDHGDTAIEVSRYTLFGEGGQMIDRGKYIIIWKLVDGRWLLARDIFNSSLPAPGQ
jgi:uncharacterized protein (TIGR02246 family)